MSRISRQKGTSRHNPVMFLFFSIQRHFRCSVHRVLQSVKNGTSGTQGPHSQSRNDNTHSDNRNPHSHHESHKQTKRHQPPQPCYVFIFFNPTPFSLLHSPSFAVRQKRHKRNPTAASAYEERLFAFREPKPALAPEVA